MSSPNDQQVCIGDESQIDKIEANTSKSEHDPNLAEELFDRTLRHIVEFYDPDKIPANLKLLLTLSDTMNKCHRVILVLQSLSPSIKIEDSDIFSTYFRLFTEKLESFNWRDARLEAYQRLLKSLSYQMELMNKSMEDIKNLTEEYLRVVDLMTK